MKILWFPKLQFDVDKLHFTTWIEMERHLRKKGNECLIAVGNYPEREDAFTSIPFIRVKGLRMVSFWFFGYLKFIYHFFTFKPDVVILDVYTFWFSFVLATAYKKKTCFIVDNRTPIHHLTPEVSAAVRWAARLYTRLCYSCVRQFLHGMTVITEFYRKHLSEAHAFPYENIGVWGSGVDTDKFSPHKFRNLKRPDALRGKFVILQHGAFSRNRGQFESIEAMAKINREDVLLLFVGEGEAKEDLIKYAKDLGVQDRVQILPAVPYAEVPALIQVCDCALLPYPDIDYWNANNPIKLLEYLAMGKPVICTDFWTFREVLNDAECAVFLRTNHPDEIAAAISRCYNEGERLAVRGRTGMEIASKRFTWDRQSDRLLDFIQAVHTNRMPPVDASAPPGTI